MQFCYVMIPRDPNEATSNTGSGGWGGQKDALRILQPKDLCCLWTRLAPEGNWEEKSSTIRTKNPQLKTVRQNTSPKAALSSELHLEAYPPNASVSLSAKWG
jgi:hypothetical protein